MNKKTDKTDQYTMRLIVEGSPILDKREADGWENCTATTLAGNLPKEIRIDKNGAALIGIRITPDGRLILTDYVNTMYKIFVERNQTFYPDNTWDGSRKIL